MQTFGNHAECRSRYDTLRFEFFQDVLESVFTAHRSSRHRYVQSGLREEFSVKLLRPSVCRSLAGQLRDCCIPGIFFRDDGLVSANVADETFIGAMISERNGAMRALANVPQPWHCRERANPRGLRKNTIELFAFQRGVVERAVRSRI